MQDQFGISFNFEAKDNNFEFSSGVIKNVTNKSGIIGGPLNLNVAQDTKCNGTSREGNKNSLFSSNSITHNNINNPSFYMQIGTKEGTPKY